MNVTLRRSFWTKVSVTFNNIVYSGGAFVSQMKAGSVQHISSMYSNCNFNSHNLYSASTSEGPVTGYARSGSTVYVTNVNLYGAMQTTGVGTTTSGRIFGWVDTSVTITLTNVNSWVSC